MKTIYRNYKLATSGKIITVSLQALFRAVGIDGEVTNGAIPVAVLDCLRVLIERPNVTGLVSIKQGVQASGTYYTVTDDELTIHVAGLRGGISRVYVCAQYGTNNPAALVCELDAPQNVAFLEVDGSFTPLERAAEKDAETEDGAYYYAYVYKHGNVVIWFAEEKLDKHGNTVTAFVADGLDAEFDDATEEQGRIVYNVSNVPVYDEEEDVVLSPNNIFGGAGGGNENLLIGTQEEREALTDVAEGVQFNEVHYNEETDTYTCTRYLYCNREWVEIVSPVVSPVETVVLHVTTYDGEGDVEGLHVGITDNNTGAGIERELDENGECTFEIPKGHTYVVSIETLSGYHALADETFTAYLDMRNITLTFQAITAGTETVVVKARVFDAQGQDITEDDVDTLGLEVNVQIEGEEEPLVEMIDSDHQCTFNIPYGKRYTVNFPQALGYALLYGNKQTHIASILQREVDMFYYQLGEVGIYGMDADGVDYSYEQMQAMTETERASIIAVHINTSALQAAGNGFAYKLPVVTASKSWAGSNVEFDRNILPFKTNHAEAVLDLDGKTNTDNIIAIGDVLSVATAAADYCREQTLVIGGVTHEGFLGAYGQMYALAENIVTLNAIHALLGKAAPTFTSGGWWTATQGSASNAVDLSSGGFGNYSKNTSGTTVALFAL